MKKQLDSIQKPEEMSYFGKLIALKGRADMIFMNSLLDRINFQSDTIMVIIIWLLAITLICIKLLIK